MAEANTKESQPEPSSQGVQLGIGTLLIIALIVTMCSGRSEMEKIQKDTSALKQQLGVIEGKLDALAAKEGGAASANVHAPSATPTEAVEASSPNP